MTHELKTPLQTISGITEILNKESLNKKNHKYLKTINFSVTNLLGLINNAVMLNSKDKSNLKLDKKPFALSDTIRGIVDSVGITNQTNNKLYIDIDSSLENIKVLGDEQKLTQILCNLIDNSNKYTDNGHIYIQAETITSSKEEVTIKFNVSDTGVGISNESLDKVFDEFYKESMDFTANCSGPGLGLSIVKLLVELHNSEIIVESKKAEGATFSFVFTYQIAPIEKFQIENIKIDASKINVLLVEDHKINQMLIKKTIEKKGFVNCKVTNNGLEAVNFVKEEKFDIVLTDIMMPVMDGFESSLLIKQYNKNIPIIAITAVCGELEKENFERSQIDFVINKPIKPDELYKAMYKELSLIKV
ncbi:hybrid sensor histidine kinase/response regulator [Thalassobellus citreus]|uniref:hybrid sensor histidine kinase/response regulator n=1 Tax=Thalassobellus citreus TaxID=3367752 RepID=UPI0037B5FA5F